VKVLQVIDREEKADLRTSFPPSSSSSSSKDASSSSHQGFLPLIPALYLLSTLCSSSLFFHNTPFFPLPSSLLSFFFSFSSPFSSFFLSFLFFLSFCFSDPLLRPPVRGYMGTATEVLMNTIEERFKTVWNYCEGDIDLMIEEGKHLLNDLQIVANKVVVCFPTPYNILPFFVFQYHRQFHRFLTETSANADTLTARQIISLGNTPSLFLLLPLSFFLSFFLTSSFLIPPSFFS
jgi:hypothetical protein